MPIALVQQQAGNSGNLNFPSPTTPGNFLACIITHRGTSVSTGPTSTHGTWVLAVARTHASSLVKTEIWYRQNLTGTSTNVSLPGGTPDRRSYILEYSGVVRFAPSLDKTASDEGNSASPTTGTTAATIKANELWLGAVALEDGGRTFSAPTNGFTILAQGFSGGGANETSSAVLHLIPGVTGTANTTVTSSFSDFWTGAIATFLGSDLETLTATVPGASTVAASMLSADNMTALILPVSNVTATLERLRRITTTIPAASTVAGGSLTRLRTLTGQTIPGFSTMGAGLDVTAAELIVTSVVEGESAAQGGEEVTLLGTFPVGQPVQVHVGPTNTIVDPIAYSGVPGQGNNYFPRLPDRLRIFLPRLDPGVYRIHVESPGASYTLVDAITIRPKQFRSNTFGLRRILPSRWDVGPRHIEEEP